MTVCLTGITAPERHPRVAAGRLALSGLLLALALFMPVYAHAATPVQGDQIINTVRVTSAAAPPLTASASVTAVIRTPSTIEYLQYAPKMTGAPAIQLVPGAYRPDANPALPFVPLPLPVMAGSATPIDLSQPIPLVPTNQLHQGDPLFVRVTDQDQNLNRRLAETIFITITNTTNGDTEVVRLTETGPDTGVFAGYLPTARDPAVLYNGSMSVREGDSLQVRYVDIVDNSDTSTTSILVDPFGIVLDSGSGQPLNGAIVTMVNASSGLPAVVFGDDGVSSYPAAITSGASASDSSGRVYSFQAGGYRFPFVRPGSYRFDIKPPPGYSSPSTVVTAAIQALPNGPFVIVPGSRGEMFVLNSDPSLRVDIPLDPAPSSLWLQKSSSKDTAGHGDFVPYQLTVTNTSPTGASGVIRLADTLPVGFRLRRGSVMINNAPAADPAISADGRTLTFSMASLASAASSSLAYVAEVTAGARIGPAVNSAIANSAAGAQSNNARAAVTVRDDFLRSRSILMGRVTAGACLEESGEGKDGVAGVRVYLEDGTFVVSDKQGLFHFEGVRPGLHALQLDLDSIPDDYEAYPCTENSRFAGRAFSQFVETQGGTLWRTDFHIRPKVQPPVAAVVAVKQETQPATATRPDKGRVSLELANAVEGQQIAYRVALRGEKLPVQATYLKVSLPAGVLYEPGSSRLDGVPLPDPDQPDKTLLVYPLGSLPVDWAHEITFRGRPSRGGKPSKLVTSAYLAADGARGTVVLTAPAETSMLLDINSAVQHVPEIVLRPHFQSFSDELSADDREKLDELARLLIALHTEKIHVTGHTDNLRIALRSRSIFRDNRALSVARAKSVGRYLMAKLNLPPEKLSLEGKGDEVPLAGNGTSQGRALNRYVEVRVASSRVYNLSQLSVLKAFSGEQGAAVVQENRPRNQDSESEAQRLTLAALESLHLLQSLPPAAAAVSGKQPVFVPVATSAAAATVPAATAVMSQTPTVAAASPVVVGTASAAAVLKAAPVEEPAGFVGRKEGDLLVNRINAVQFKLESALTARLLVDGVEVPARQLGFRRQEKDSGNSYYGYIGVDFGAAGQHTLTLQGLDPFGNARFDRSIRLVRTGEIASIRVRSVAGNVADGKTPVRIQLELYDISGNPVHADAELELRDGTLKPVVPDSGLLEDKVASRRLIMDREGWIAFQPVVASGPYRVTIGYNAASIVAVTYVQPKLRDWILVGLAEGTLGYNAVSGNMESLRGAGVDENLYKDGRIALFAKGQVQGKWLLTMAYDTAKTRGNSADGLFQTINPETFYTLYGDAGQQQYDAASTRKLYLKIEREQFYAMFGDYDTGLAVTELSRYSRRMTGIKTELQTRDFEINAFASEADKAYVRDEIPGDGTSGLYRISRRNIVPNSEKITIEVRDRFRSEILISSSSLARFTDYSIDYETGALIFKEPVHNRDLQLNPVFIVAEYEARTDAGQDYTYGGRAGVKLFEDTLKAGGTYLHEGQGGRAGNLYGVDSSLKLGQTTRLRAEYAASDFSAASTRHSGNAYLAEALHNSKEFDAKAYIREQDTGFGLGQQPGSEAGTRKFGAEGTYRITSQVSTNANVYRQYNLLDGAVRDVAEGRLNYSDKLYGASVGLLHADDRLGDGSSHASTQMTLGGKVLTLYDRLTLTLDHAQSILGNSNSDFPTRTALGAEFKALTNLTLLAVQELTWGTGAITQNTRLGLRATPWKGASMSSSVERQFNENSERVFANVGLKQTWQISEAWKIDAGLDRSQTLARSAQYQFNTNVPPASGSSESFLAATGGATYQVKHLTWDNRLELRLADSEKRWGLMSGLVNEVDSSWAWSGRAQLFQTSAASGIDTTKANLRYGLVFRPPQTTWILLNRLDCFLDHQSGSGPATDFTSWRVVNNLNANYRPRKDLQISLQYGAKVVREMIVSRSYSSFTDHIGLEARYDVTKQWDIGMRGSLLHSWHGDQLSYSFGPSAGYNILENIWISLGYNVWGFDDKDFASAAYTAQGPFVRFRMKFDQQTVKDAASWLNKQ